MPVIANILRFADELTLMRRDFHKHPELGFEEHRTSAIIGDYLENLGITVTRGIGGTGLVGTLVGRAEGRSIGLRADMDALPMDERTGLLWASVNPGVFHGCGHDGHVTMLLGAARHLAETRDFDGCAVFIFQPAEEGLGGARAMIADGLFARFPCDELYGMHNSPYREHGNVSIRSGLAQAGACFFDIEVIGQGSHGAMPQVSRDPIAIGSMLVSELQTIVSRNADPTHACVVSVTQFQGGAAYNVIPERAVLGGTFRYFDPADEVMIANRLKAICAGIALAHEVEITVDIRNIFSVLVNDPERTSNLIDVAKDIVGEDANADAELTMGSEDMADLLQVVPGAFFNLGHRGTIPLHNPAYIFDDAVLPVGASILARIVERRGIS